MLESLRILFAVLAGMQAALMLVDERVFHRRRGLERFERWGHVADTGLFFAALCIPAFFEASRAAVSTFVALAFASCLLITKDEWIHAKVCEAHEHWCHAMLFVLHGALLTIVGCIWVLQAGVWEIKALASGVFCWGIYQHLYWNVYHVRISHQ